MQKNTVGWGGGGGKKEGDLLIFFPWKGRVEMGKQNHLQAKKVYSFICSDHFLSSHFFNYPKESHSTRITVRN